MNDKMGHFKTWKDLSRSQKYEDGRQKTEQGTIQRPQNYFGTLHHVQHNGKLPRYSEPELAEVKNLI